MHNIIKIMSENDVCEYNLLFPNSIKTIISVSSSFLSYMYYETKEE